MGDYNYFCTLVEKANFEHVIKKLLPRHHHFHYGSISRKNPIDKSRRETLFRIENLQELPDMMSKYEAFKCLDLTVICVWHFIVYNETISADVSLQDTGVFAETYNQYAILRIDPSWDNKVLRFYHLPMDQREKFMEIISWFEPTFGFADTDAVLPFEREKLPNSNSSVDNIYQLIRHKAKFAYYVQTFALPISAFPLDSLEFLEVNTVGNTRFLLESRGFGNELQLIPRDQQVDTETEISWDEYEAYQPATLEFAQKCADEISTALDILEGRT